MSLRAKRTIVCAVAALVLAALTAPAGASAAPTCTGTTSYAVTGGVPVHLTADCTGSGSLSYTIVSGPSHGQFTDLVPGSLTYTADRCWNSTDGFQFNVTDSTGTTLRTVDFTVTPASDCGPNNPPVCQSSELAVAVDGVLPLGLGSCSDPDNDPLSVYSFTSPSLGTFGPPAGGKPFSYHATTGQPGQWDQFTYRVSDGQGHVSDPATVRILILPSGATPQSLPAGGGVYTTPDPPSDANPVQTSIASPNGGTVGVFSEPHAAAESAPTGFTFFGQHLEIAAPLATAANPLVLSFTLNTADPSRIAVFRDGTEITSSCSTAVLPAASPDPCADVTVIDGFATVTVRASHASSWDFGLRKFAYSGFFSPVNNGSVLNLAQAGSTVPVKFSLTGDQGLGVVAGGYPRSQAIACDSTAPVDGVDATASPGSSVLSYDAVLDRYQYNWKTAGTWTGCRQFVLRLSDGTVHRANFRFR